MNRLLWLLLLYPIVLSSCSWNNKTLKIKGSDTEVNLAAEIAEQFHKVDKQYTVSVSGGGSGLGISSLLNGQADIANSSRPLSEEEKKMFADKNIVLKTIVFAEDATAIIVNSSLPIDEIDVMTLGKIMSGEITNWREIGGPDLEINIYGRQSSSGTHSFVQKKLKIKFTPNAKEMNGNAQIIEGVKVDKSGIGYVGAGYISHNDAAKSKVKILSIKKDEQSIAISPVDEAAIKADRYYLQRPLYQFIPMKSWEKAKSFIAFEKGEKGQQLIKKSGYYIVDSI